MLMWITIGLGITLLMVIVILVASYVMIARSAKAMAPIAGLSLVFLEHFLGTDRSPARDKERKKRKDQK
jgi:hypothetical protein